MTTPDSPFDPRDHATCDRDRRRFLGLSFAAAAALAGLPAFAQDDDKPYLNHGDSRVKAAAERYRSQPSYDTFLAWTDLLRHHGDIDLARDNLRQLEPYREQWGRYRDRIERIYHAVSFKQFVVEW